MEQRTRRWLIGELEQWVSDGVITDAQRDEIAVRYPPVRGTSPLLVAFAVIGTLLIGAGIILVFATNWWALPMGVRLVLAFVPLLMAQGLCLYTAKKRYGSAAFREGSALSLSLAFCAALALVGQIFHLPGDLGSFVLVCILATLPGAYLFRGRAAISIYVVGAVFVAGYWPVWVFWGLTVLCLPFFYREITGTAQSRGANYLLLLLSVLAIGTVVTLEQFDLGWLEMVLLSGLALLVLDALFCKLGRAYFFTACKLLAVGCTTWALFFSLMDLRQMAQIGPLCICLTAALVAAYLLLRRGSFPMPTGGDLICAGAVAVMLVGVWTGW